MEFGSAQKGVKDAHHTYVGYFEQEKYEEALKWNETACKICENTPGLGPMHPSTIAEKHNRALILAHTERVDEAVRYISKMLDECEEEFGPGDKNHEMILATMDKASTVHRIGERYELADMLSEQACRGYEAHKKFGPTHSTTLSVMCRRALLLESRGKYEYAEKLYEKIYANQKVPDPPDPPDLDAILTMYYRARVSKALQRGITRGAYEEAKKACQLFLDKYPGNSATSEKVRDIKTKIIEVVGV